MWCMGWHSSKCLYWDIKGSWVRPTYQLFPKQCTVAALWRVFTHMFYCNYLWNHMILTGMRLMSICQPHFIIIQEPSHIGAREGIPPYLSLTRKLNLLYCLVPILSVITWCRGNYGCANFPSLRARAKEVTAIRQLAIMSHLIGWRYHPLGLKTYLHGFSALSGCYKP